MKTVEITYRYVSGGVPARPRPLDSDAALRQLNDGNRVFTELIGDSTGEGNVARRVVEVDLSDLGLSENANNTAPRQRPFAAILGCSDARVPVELIFNQGPNDLFVVRVAGNGLGPEVLGSLKYAVDHLHGSLKLIVVLGHSGCGAVSAAVDVFLNPGEYLSLATQSTLRAILDGLLVVVQASARKLMAVFGPGVVDRPGYRLALIEASVVTNAALAAYSIQQELDRSDLSGLRVAYGVYLLETREVWTPCLGQIEGMKLAAAPRDLKGFGELGDAVIQSKRFTSLLKSED